MTPVDAGLAAWMIFIARLCMASVFLVSAVHKAGWYRKAEAEFRGEGVPVAGVLLPLVIALHGVGSLALISGIYAQEFALLLALFTLAVSFKVHNFWRTSGDERLEQSRIFAANIAIVGGLILLAAVGPGSRVL